MPHPGQNVIRKPLLTVIMIGVKAADYPEGIVPSEEIGMADLILEAGAPAVSARVPITGNDAIAMIVPTVSSSSLKWYGAATNVSDLYPIEDVSGSGIEMALQSERCVVFGDLLRGFNYLAAEPDLTEAAQRTIVVLTVPR